MTYTSITDELLSDHSDHLDHEEIAEKFDISVEEVKDYDIQVTTALNSNGFTEEEFQKLCKEIDEEVRNNKK